MTIETTFGMVKSKGLEYTGLVLERIVKQRFAIIRAEHVNLTNEQITMLYVEHTGKPYFMDLCQSVSGGVVAIAMRRDNAVAEWRKLMGPTDPKKNYPPDIRYLAYGETIMANNIVHGSDSLIAAAAELCIVFGDRWVQQNMDPAQLSY